MTEQKAIDNLVSMKVEIEYETNDTKQMKRIKCETIKTAISALEEIRQYREIGTVEEIGEAFEHWEKKAAIMQFVINRYLEIGSVEECREAVYKMKPEKPIAAKDKYSNVYACPCCGYILIHKDETGWFCGKKYKSCPECAKKIDWSEEDEID